MSKYPRNNYYKKKGCCLSCPKSHKGCICYDCKCASCIWYDLGYDIWFDDKKPNQKCFIAFYLKLGWEYKKILKLVWNATDKNFRHYLISDILKEMDNVFNVECVYGKDFNEVLENDIN